MSAAHLHCDTAGIGQVSKKRKLSDATHTVRPVGAHLDPQQNEPCSTTLSSKKRKAGAATSTHVQQQQPVQHAVGRAISAQINMKPKQPLQTQQMQHATADSVSQHAAGRTTSAQTDMKAGLPQWQNSKAGAQQGLCESSKGKRQRLCQGLMLSMQVQRDTRPKVRGILCLDVCHQSPAVLQRYIVWIALLTVIAGKLIAERQCVAAMLCCVVLCWFDWALTCLSCCTLRLLT